jgi:hypothetical protein
MSHLSDIQSGPDNGEHEVDYENEEIGLRPLSADEASDSDSSYPSDSDSRRRGKNRKSASSKQVNTVKKSVLNARAASSAAASNGSSSSADSAVENSEVRELVKQYEKKLKELTKRQRELDEREKSGSSKSSKRTKSSSSSRKRSSDPSDSSDNGVSSDESGNDSDSDSSDRGSRRSSSSSSGKNGKDITLRQHAIMNKFENMQYVDIRIFKRENLNIRKKQKLAPIKSSAEYSAAWASFNVEMQQYLLNANRSVDAFMVSRYYAQIVGLLTDYSTQWQSIMDLDEYIRGATFAVDEPIVWSIDRDDEYISRFRHDIRSKHHDITRVSSSYALSNQRGALISARGNGVNVSNTFASSRKRVCFAYNGLNSTTSQWDSSSHCLGAHRCKFAHKCIHCNVDGHAIYERAECAAHPRVRPPARQTPARG